VALRRAVDDVAAGRFEWIVFTSVNGVHRFFADVPDARVLGATRVAAIGPGTSAALALCRIVADIVPDRYVAEGLLDVFPDAHDSVDERRSTRGRRVLLPRAAKARDVLPEGLRAKGWNVDVVEAYRTVPARPDPTTLEAAATADAICFTSSSTVDNYLAAAGRDRVPAIVSCIGPITAATARDHGLDVAVEASTHTINGLVDALAAHLQGTQ
jgi:uroporphyrinogen III methyltransferase/synthase